MKQEVIEKGIWSIEEFNHLKRNTITEINGYNGSNELRLSITQLMDRSSYQQNKLVKEWCKLLPTLKSVEYLWLPSRVNQKIFDSICRMPNLKSLWIKWSGIKSIEAIENLHKLEHLHIGSSSQIVYIA